MLYRKRQTTVAVRTCVCLLFLCCSRAHHIHQLYQEIGKVSSAHGETPNWRGHTNTNTARSVERATIVLICTVEHTQTDARARTPSDSRVRKLSYYVSGVSARAEESWPRRN